MLAVSKTECRVARVAGGIGGEKDGLDFVVFDHFFQRRVSFGTAASFGEVGATIGEQIAHGENFDIWVVLKAKSCPELAQAITDYPNANFPVRNRFPALGSIGIFRGFFQTGNGFLFCCVCAGKSQRGGEDAC